MIWIQNQLVGAYIGQQVTLECHSEAYPKSINYWTKDTGEMIAQGRYANRRSRSYGIRNDEVAFKRENK